MLPGAANDRRVQGLPLTVKLLEKYRLLQECARHPASDSPRSCDCDPCAILENLRCSRGSTADVIEKIDLALKAAQVAAELETAYDEAMIGQTYPVLFEQIEHGHFTGHAPNYVKVYAKGEGLHNVIKHVRITGLFRDGVVGEIL